MPFGKVQDFTPFIAKIKASGADTILTGNWGPDLVRLVKYAAGAKVNSLSLQEIENKILSLIKRKF